MRYLLVLIILFTGCVIDDPKPKPIATNTECASYLYTYEKNKKIDLSSRLINNYITVGFESTDYEKTKSSVTHALSSFLTGKQFSFISAVDDSVRFNMPEEFDTYESTIVYELNNPFRCNELNDLRLKLLKIENVKFVSFLYHRTKLKSDSDVNILNIDDFDPSSHNFHSDEFKLKLHNSEDIELLNQMIEKTKTTLVKEFSTNYFLIRTDVNSKGDALKMANYFHESNLFEFCFPGWNSSIIDHDGTNYYFE
jgi:hypothetical protein